MARPPNTDERRAQIAAALVRVMARRGYEGASVAAIARAAKLTPGLVHYHFESKEEILLVAIRALVARHDERLEARLAGLGGDPVDAVLAFVDFHVGLGADADADALAVWILASGEALRRRQVRVEHGRALGRSVARLAGVIRNGVAHGSFRCGDADGAAAALVAAIQGYYVLAATARSLVPRGSAAVSVKRMADGLLRPARPLAARSAA